MARFACVAWCVLLGMWNVGHSETYPSKPIRIVVGYTAGGATDLLARVVGEKLTATMGQQTIVDNRPGAGGVIATTVVARSSPDGYTLLMGSFSLAVNASLYGNLQYDTLRDLAPVSLVATTPYLLVVHPSMPVNNMRQLVALAKAKPAMLTYASAGNGSGAHLSGELLRRLARIDIIHVPYKGAAPATADVLGGQVTMTFVNILQTLPLVRAGKLRALGVTTARRSQIAPEIPTIAEGGVAGYELDGWFGILAPGGTPKSVIVPLQKAIADYLKSDEARKRFHVLGVEPSGSTAEAFGQFLAAEVDKWGDVVRSAGIKVK